LTHEVAYGSVLQDRRRALHEAIVDAIERLYADRLPEHVERLAHHATRGEDLSKAVRYLREATSRAVARSANQEAVAYCEQALGCLEKLPQTAENLHHALEIHIALGSPLVALKGPGSEEVQRTYTRAVEMVDRLGAHDKRFPALWGLWFVSYSRGRYTEALGAGERLLELARNGDDAGQLLEAHHSLWPTLVAMGRPLQAMSHFEQGIALYDRERHGTYAHLYSHDPGACCRWHLGMAHWLLGYPERALSGTQDACRLAEELKHPQTMAIGIFFNVWVHCQRGERGLALAGLERLGALAREHAFAPWIETSDTLIRIMQLESKGARSVDQLCQQLTSSKYVMSWRRAGCLCVLAELCSEWGHADEGLRALRSIPEEHRGTFMAPEILRLEGELMLKHAEPAIGEAKGRFRSAIELGRERGEKSLELRAATSLARLLDGEGRREEAHATLAGVYDWFTEGFDTADLKSAKTLLDSLRARGA